jgi:hypothetical protein
MFLTLLAVTFIISLLVSGILVVVFKKPIGSILQRIMADEISTAWKRYLDFAILVIGVSSGVRIWDLEKYITPPVTKDGSAAIVALNSDRWVLEVYRTVIGAMQGVAWMLLVFFIFALIAFVVVRAMEMGRARKSGE